MRSTKPGSLDPADLESQSRVPVRARRRPRLLLSAVPGHSLLGSALFRSSAGAVALLLTILLPLGLAHADECPDGLERRGDACVTLISPGAREGACPRGERWSGNACEPVAVPEFASLDASGTDFECWRGYRRQGSTCEELNVPPNADLDTSGHAWRCRRGFRAAGATCAEIRVPEFASLDSAGNDWRCWRGYQRVQNACERIEVPRYARLTTDGNAWECWPGYRTSGSTCERLEPGAYQAALAEQQRRSPAGGADERGATATEEAQGDAAAGRTEADSTGAETGPTLVVSGRCGDEVVAGLLSESISEPGDSGGESGLVRGRLSAGSGQSYEFEGALRPGGRIEGIDDRDRSCDLELTGGS